MNRCKNGYPVGKDLIPPERCHCYPTPDSCKDCYEYNQEYDLIDRAIESAKCRKYKVINEASGGSMRHQVKAKNQEELIGVTIRALEYYRDNYVY